MKKITYVALGIGAIIVASVALYFPAYLWFFPYLHNQTLERFSEQLINIPLPEKTERIDSKKVVGQLSGNSDHCDYFSGVILRTNLPKAELESYYQNQYTGKSNLRFFWFDKDRSSEIEIYPLKDWVEQRSKDRRNPTAVIYIYEGAMTSAIDYRCS